MTTYNENLQQLFQEYELAGNPTPPTSKQVATWAFHNKRWVPRQSDAINMLARDLSEALRQEFVIDRQGPKSTLQTCGQGGE